MLVARSFIFHCGAMVFPTTGFLGECIVWFECGGALGKNYNLVRVDCSGIVAVVTQNVRFRSMQSNGMARNTLNSYIT